jgi:hypothetical protein
MPREIKRSSDLRPGDFYEDCAYHPCVCVAVDPEDDEIRGISLVDGSFPRACSGQHCGVRQLTFEEAVRWKLQGPADVDVESTKRWWT